MPSLPRQWLIEGRRTDSINMGLSSAMDHNIHLEIAATSEQVNNFSRMAQRGIKPQTIVFFQVLSHILFHLSSSTAPHFPAMPGYCDHKVA